MPAGTQDHTVVACRSSGMSLNPQCPKPQTPAKGEPPPPATKTSLPDCQKGQPVIPSHSPPATHVPPPAGTPSMYLTRQFGFFSTHLVCAAVNPSKRQSNLVRPTRWVINPHFALGAASGLESRPALRLGCITCLVYRHLPLFPLDIGSLLWKPEAGSIHRRQP